MSARYALRRLPLRPSLTITPSVRASSPVLARCVSNVSRINSSLPYVDNDINGGYYNPPAEKRQFRDPYGDWWDKQDRRNFGEPVHEDNDVLTIFSTEQHTHFTAQKSAKLFATAVGVFLAGCGVLWACSPERPMVRRTWEDGLEKELGGSQALTARRDPSDL